MKVLIKKIAWVILLGLIRIAKLFGYTIDLSVSKIVSTSESKGINLNVGAGGYVIPGFLSLDLYTPHYYKNKVEFLKNRTEYDLRGDNLPFGDKSVDNIYISHVIEHVESQFVIKFINESYRVLKEGGVLRIACPDGDFLYRVSKFNNGYWSWLYPDFSNKERYKTDWEKIEQYDFLLRETSTPRCRFYVDKISEAMLLPNDVKELSYQDYKQCVRSDLVFRKENPGDHINVWDFAELHSIGLSVGFRHVVESKHRGSVSAVMQSSWFDKTAPQMSLYMDFVK